MRHYRRALTDLVLTLPQPVVMAEIGVHQGRTANFLLSEILTLTMYCVDNYKPYKEATQQDQDVYSHYAMGRLREPQIGNRAKLIIKDSLDAVRIVPDCDIVFVDADHSEESCYADLCAWWPKSKLILCAHDYGKDDIPGVTIAVDRFAAEQGLTPEIIDGHIAVFRKPNGAD